MVTHPMRLLVMGLAISLSTTACDSKNERGIEPYFERSLVVAVLGKGVVRTVNSADPSMGPMNIDCGVFSNGETRDKCKNTFPNNSSVTLYAFPVPGWQLAGWCNGSIQPTITITMTTSFSCEVRFIVDPDYAFTLSLSQSAITVAPGATGDVTATLTRGANFAGFPVTLSLVNPPAGITLAGNPNPTTGDSSTLTIQVDTSVPDGNQHLLTILAVGTNGNNDTVERTAFLTLTVPGSDFNLSLLPSALDLVPGETGVSTVALSRELGFTTDVVLMASGLPPGVTATFAPNPASGTSSQLTVTTDGNAPLGTYPLTVTGSSGTLIRTASMTLRLVASQTFDISVVQPSITIQQGGRLDPATPVNITRHPFFIGGIDFTISGVPPGVLATFDPNPASGNTTHLAIAVSPTAILGSYPLTIIGTAGGVIRQTMVTLTVVAGQQVCPWVATADSYVGPQVQPSVAGTAPLRIDSSSLQRAAKTYLAFDTGAIALPFDKVELVLSLNFNSGAAAAGANRIVEAYGITDNNDWNLSVLPETSIAWNNAPKNNVTSQVDFNDWGGTPPDSSRYLGRVVVRPTDPALTLYRFDITDYVRWAMGQNAGYSAFATRDDDGFITIMLGHREVYNQSIYDFTEFMDRSYPIACARPHLEVY